MNKVLSKAYQLENDAERATLRQDLGRAIEYHIQASQMLREFRETFQENSLESDFHAAKSVDTLVAQIEQRIEELRRLERLKQQPREQKTTTKAVEDDHLTSGLLSQMSSLLVKHMSVDMAHRPVVSLPSDPQVAEMQRQLVALTSATKKDKSHQTENELLVKLNAYYLSQIHTQRQLIQEMCDLVYDTSHGQSPRLDDGFKTIVADLQQQLSEAEKDKVILESQVVKLKERWNALVESARKKKEMERRKDSSAT